MLTYTQQQIDAQYAKLPPELKDALYGVDIAEKLFAIGQNAGITIEERGFLGEETGFVILGLTHPEDFQKRIKERLDLTDDDTTKIAKAVNEQIFAPLREALKKAHGAQESGIRNQESTASVAGTSAKPSVPVPPQVSRPVPPPPSSPSAPRSSFAKISQEMAAELKSAVPQPLAKKIEEPKILPPLPVKKPSPVSEITEAPKPAIAPKAPEEKKETPQRPPWIRGEQKTFIPPALSSQPKIPPIDLRKSAPKPEMSRGVIFAPPVANTPQTTVSPPPAPEPKPIAEMPPAQEVKKAIPQTKNISDPYREPIE